MELRMPFHLARIAMRKNQTSPIVAMNALRISSFCSGFVSTNPKARSRICAWQESRDVPVQSGRKDVEIIAE